MTRDPSPHVKDTYIFLVIMSSWAQWACFRRHVSSFTTLLFLAVFLLGLACHFYAHLWIPCRKASLMRLFLATSTFRHLYLTALSSVYLHFQSFLLFSVFWSYAALLGMSIFSSAIFGKCRLWYQGSKCAMVECFENSGGWRIMSQVQCWVASWRVSLNMRFQIALC